MDLGADALGFNFHAPSPRSVTPAVAWDIIRRLPPLVSVVGVFVNWPTQAVAAIAHALHMDAVQLHGDEVPEVVNELAATFHVVKAFRVKPGFRATALRRYRGISAYLLDGYTAGLYGGTGREVDWRIAQQGKKYGRIILAGGIKPGNVAKAITDVAPYGIDVASGVESRPGKKDGGALRALMQEVAAARWVASKEA